MLSAERRNLILEQLRRDERVLVSELVKQYQVSDETIRRDLLKLEQEGLAMRSYGGAVLAEEGRTALPYKVRKKTRVEEKRVIAALVAELIDDGDFIMLDESSTALYVAKSLKHKRNLTVVTNSVEMILDLADMEDWKIICTGGSLKKDELALYGSRVIDTIRSYHVDKAIISCTALDMDAGYTDAGEDNALVKRAMMESARQTILTVDSGKFDKTAFAQVGNLSKLTALVTDHKPSQAWRDRLNEEGVKLIWKA